MLLTLTRRQETAMARWRDVDLEARTWTILETKNGEPHVVPLSRQAMDLLRSCQPADDAGSAKRPDPSALIFATSSGASLGNWDRETKRIIVACGLGKEDAKTGAVSMKDGSALWTRHDLRRTGATMLGEMGELPDIIEAALNHVSIRSPLAATYNRSRYRPQVAARAATAGGRAGRDRGWGGAGGAAAGRSLTRRDTPGHNQPAPSAILPIRRGGFGPIRPAPPRWAAPAVPSHAEPAERDFAFHWNTGNVTDLRQAAFYGTV